MIPPTLSFEDGMGLFKLEHFHLFWDNKKGLDSTIKIDDTMGTVEGAKMDPKMDTKCLVAWSKDTILLSFRGTASMSNVISDLQACSAIIIAIDADGALQIAKPQYTAVFRDTSRDIMCCIFCKAWRVLVTPRIISLGQHTCLSPLPPWSVNGTAVPAGTTLAVLMIFQIVFVRCTFRPSAQRITPSAATGGLGRLSTRDSSTPGVPTALASASSALSSK